MRYATLRSSKAELYYRHESYGEPDAQVGWTTTSGCCATGRRRSWSTAASTPRSARGAGGPACARRVDALRALGIEPESVSTVVVTHLHYDHIGNLAAFPARALVPRASSTSGRARWPTRFQFALDVEPAEIALVARSGCRRAGAADRGTEEICAA